MSALTAVSAVFYVYTDILGPNVSYTSMMFILLFYDKGLNIPYGQMISEVSKVCITALFLRPISEYNDSSVLLKFPTSSVQRGA